jgi:hypothetical protein
MCSAKVWVCCMFSSFLQCRPGSKIRSRSIDGSVAKACASDFAAVFLSSSPVVCGGLDGGLARRRVCQSTWCFYGNLLARPTAWQQSPTKSGALRKTEHGELASLRSRRAASATPRSCAAGQEQAKRVAPKARSAAGIGRQLIALPRVTPSGQGLVGACGPWLCPLRARSGTLALSVPYGASSTGLRAGARLAECKQRAQRRRREGMFGAWRAGPCALQGYA